MLRRSHVRCRRKLEEHSPWKPTEERDAGARRCQMTSSHKISSAWNFPMDLAAWKSFTTQVKVFSADILGKGQMALDLRNNLEGEEVEIGSSDYSLEAWLKARKNVQQPVVYGIEIGFFKKVGLVDQVYVLRSKSRGEEKCDIHGEA